MVTHFILERNYMYRETRIISVGKTYISYKDTRVNSLDLQIASVSYFLAKFYAFCAIVLHKSSGKREIFDGFWHLYVTKLK